jgi:phage shock protein E
MTTDKLLLLIVLAAGAAYFFVARSGSISSSDARQLVESGGLLVDVRTPGEFGAGHLPGAINLPVQDLDRRMNELGDKERSIVLYCRSGSRSAQAGRMLKGAGYTKVHDLGAMSSW